MLASIIKVCTSLQMLGYMCEFMCLCMCVCVCETLSHVSQRREAETGIPHLLKWQMPKDLQNSLTC